MSAKKDFRKTAKKNFTTEVRSVMNSCQNLNRCGRNLTLMYLEGKLDNTYHRDSEIKSIQKILLRKNKANVLLTGSAGCGKTAIVEGLAEVLAERAIDAQEKVEIAQAEYSKSIKKYEKAFDKATANGEFFNAPRPEYNHPNIPILSDAIVFELSLTALAAGTKYRGDFEEKLQNILNEIKQYPNIILFIDEIHQMSKTGEANDGMGMGQMIKPALARKDICVIGATTTEEAQFIWKDKALARRFNEVKVEPLQGEKAQETAKKIFADYCAYHNISTAENYAEEILTKVRFFQPNAVFPDGFINVVDETLAGARFDGLTEVNMSHFNATLSRMTGVVIL